MNPKYQIDKSRKKTINGVLCYQVLIGGGHGVSAQWIPASLLKETKKK